MRKLSVYIEINGNSTHIVKQSHVRLKKSLQMNSCVY